MRGFQLKKGPAALLAAGIVGLLALVVFLLEKVIQHGYGWPLFYLALALMLWFGLFCALTDDGKEGP